jgi:uncharacterized protein (DUF1810 family)
LTTMPSKKSSSVSSGRVSSAGESPDPYNLQRFVDAQRPEYEHAIMELRAGEKRGHWMWFIFPQIEGLGVSATSRRYAISSLEEARAYISHPLLGSRLVECGEALTQPLGKSAREIMGCVDAKKLRSSMTLFGAADPTQPAFRRVLETYFDGEEDAHTAELLEAQADTRD